MFDTSAIKNNIKEAIRVYEPRADYKTLKVRCKELDDANSLQIDVVFRVINSGEEVTLTTQLNRLR
jgi:predicted component of type VI protein secretion system